MRHSSVCVRYACIAIQHSCFPYSHTNIHILNSPSVRLSATFMPFIAMLMFGVCVAVQSAICLQHNAIFLLDIELHAWVSWPSDGTPLYKTCGLKSGRGLHVKMAAFRRAYDIIQQTIESLDNPAITSFEIDGISLRLDYLPRTLVNLDSNCAPTDGIVQLLGETSSYLGHSI